MQGIILNRYYDSKIGRFIQEDSYRGDGLNLYAYVANNPVNFIDPSGYCKETNNTSDFKQQEYGDMLLDISKYSGEGYPTDPAHQLWIAWMMTYPEDRITWLQIDQMTFTDTFLLKLKRYHHVKNIDVTKLTLSQLDKLYVEEHEYQRGTLAMNAGLAAAMASNIGKEVGKRVAKEVAEEIIEESADDAIQMASKLSQESVKDKLTRYLLNMEHPVGGSKATWFKKALGFTQDNIDDLAKQIVFDPKKAVQTGITEYGTKFNQTISINGANGKVIDVTFAWMKSVKDDVVRLVTAIPTKK